MNEKEKLELINTIQHNKAHKRAEQWRIGKSTLALNMIKAIKEEQEKQEVKQ